MSTFVLVHGAYHGGWCWTKVRARLRVQGHDVRTPTLTGLGDRLHLENYDIRLDTHITDIANLLEWEDLEGVILVGHSYGGVVITGVAERAHERIARLVYVDGMVPRDGQSAIDCQGLATRALFEEYMRKGPKKFGERVPAPALFGVADAVDTAWMNERLTPHPRRTLVDKIALPLNRAAELPSAYILCSRESPISLAKHFATIAKDRVWESMTIDAGHDAMVSDPDILSAALLSFARS